MSTVNTFRIHFGSQHADIHAETPGEAREIFLKDNPKVIIKKVKLLKEGRKRR